MWTGRAWSRTDRAISTTALLDRDTPTTEGRPVYRPFRPGDLIAVRTTDPSGHETQVVLDRVTDAGDVCVMAGRWGGFDLEIVGRRVGDTNPIVWRTE